METSPADYDRRLMVRGHKRDAGDQADLFYVPTPTREVKPARREEIPGQLDMLAELGEVAHEYAPVPDAQYPGLSLPACSCGWQRSGWVRDWLARRHWEQHRIEVTP
jgi:hypothetical protein